jgi:hypothetical protein
VKFLETKMKLFPVNKGGGILQTEVKLFFKEAVHSIHNGSPPFMVRAVIKNMNRP